MSIFVLIWILVVWRCDGLQETRKYIRILDLSPRLIEYQTAWNMQLRLNDFHMKLQNQFSNIDQEQLVGTVLCLQHPAVYTLGTGTEVDSGPFKTVDDFGAELNFNIVEVDRAGQATFHGPGQLVFYPVLDLVSLFNREDFF
jgi:lipoyl(octanoyl) transferase